MISSPTHCQSIKSSIYQFTDSDGVFVRVHPSVQHFTQSRVHEFTSSQVHEFTNSRVHEFTSSHILHHIISRITLVMRVITFLLCANPMPTRTLTRIVTFERNIFTVFVHHTTQLTFLLRW